MIVEHPVRSEWKLVAPEKPLETTRDVYRFEVKVAAGKTVTHEVVEEHSQLNGIALSGADDQTVKLFLTSKVTSPQLKDALRKAVEFRAKLADTKRELAQVEKQLKAITDDQTRLRANLKEMPPTSAAHKRYLEKFDKQETEIEKLQAKIEEKQEQEKVQQKEYEDYLATLTVE
jgi:septal ring factor EnvC (AmiA/AmiB activator)